MKKIDLSNKRVLLTGAANGLGREMALQLCIMGADLALTDIDDSGLESLSREIGEATGKLPLIVKHDVSSREDWEKVREAVTLEWGRLDALVNNAGIMLHIPFEETSIDDFRRTHSINVESIFLGTKTFLPLLIEAGKTSAGSSIINISSIFGQVAGLMHSAYCASKGGVTMLTKSLANELPRKGYNIRCNSIHPGIMNAGVSIAGIEKIVEMGMFETTEQAVNVLMMGNPYGRPGEASEIPGAVAFLISDASTLINGSEIVLDGGHTQVL